MSADEHDKRAREVAQAWQDAGGVASELPAAILAALRSTAAAAERRGQDAERERAAAMCNADATSCDAMAREAERQGDMDGRGTRVLLANFARALAARIREGAAPLASPAQAERVSEEHGRCPGCHAPKEHDMTWCHRCWFTDPHANGAKCCCGMSAAEWRQTASGADSAATERFRIAARLRARADEKDRERREHRADGHEMWAAEAYAAASVLRSEADALEGT